MRGREDEGRGWKKAELTLQGNRPRWRWEKIALISCTKIPVNVTLISFWSVHLWWHLACSILRYYHLFGLHPVCVEPLPLSLTSHSFYESMSVMFAVNFSFFLFRVRSHSKLIGPNTYPLIGSFCHRQKRKKKILNTGIQRETLHRKCVCIVRWHVDEHSHRVAKGRAGVRLLHEKWCSACSYMRLRIIIIEFFRFQRTTERPVRRLNNPTYITQAWPFR